jgi:hypothetical protein
LNKYSPSGARLAQWQPDTATGPLDTPVTVAVDANGNVYVGDPIKDRIVRFNPDGTVGASWAMSWTNGTGKSSPIATAFFEGGLLVAAVCGATSCTAGHGDLPYNVQWSNSDGRVLSEAVGATPHGGQAAGEQPWIIITGLAGDAKGNRYIAGLIETPSRNPQPGVLEYSHGGALVGSWTLKGTGLPEGITVDNAGTVYVTYGNRILRLVR